MDTPPIIVYDEEDAREGLETCSRSFIGYFITEKPIHANSLQSALAGIWCNPKGFKVEEVMEMKFQFLFDEAKDADRVLRGSPWTFRNAWHPCKDGRGVKMWRV
ncbi:hypothetical protein SESBI_07217 [Sesbania bispinosa]|nr:hypothetical protein SESBI_07217 [Sesbania bispinosa]